MTMGDRVAVMSKGSLMQVDSPQNLYDRPDNLFVAAFIGSPQMNLLRGVYQSNGSGGKIQLGSSSFTLAIRRRRSPSTTDERVAVGIRPEHLTEAQNGDTAGNTLSGVVNVREGLGSEVIVHLEVDAHGVDTDRRSRCAGRRQSRSDDVGPAATDHQAARRRPAPLCTSAATRCICSICRRASPSASSGSLLSIHSCQRHDNMAATDVC